MPEVEAFPGQLNQVWMNLLVNAAQAIGKNVGEVTIRTQVADGFIEVAVSDTGPGIPNELLSKIFDPFFTTKPVGEGAGLGLSITFRDRGAPWRPHQCFLDTGHGCNICGTDPN